MVSSHPGNIFIDTKKSATVVTKSMQGKDKSNNFLIIIVTVAGSVIN
jgi:hypothetical protein